MIRESMITNGNGQNKRARPVCLTLSQIPLAENNLTGSQPEKNIELHTCFEYRTDFGLQKIHSYSKIHPSDMICFALST